MDEGEERTLPPSPPGEPPSLEFEPSPFWPRNLVHLFLHPGTFFSSQLSLGRTPYVVLVTYCFGISNAMERIDLNLLSVQQGRADPSWERIESVVTDSWLGYWTFVLAVGALSAVLIWLLGGWWYRVRLRWSGAANADKFRARLTYVYSSFVWSGPVVFYAVLQTLRYENYLAAWEADDLEAVFLIVFPFWSCYVSYVGATSLFELKRARARLWFLILPGLLYAVATMAIILAVALGGLAE